jgi:hypothetical protein
VENYSISKYNESERRRKRVKFTPKPKLQSLNKLRHNLCDNRKDCLGIGTMRREFVLMGILVLLMVLAFSARLTLVSAQNSSVGVQTGNYFEYAVSISGSQAIDSPAYNLVNATATVSNVTDSVVTYSLDAQYQNGTIRSVTASTNVTSGETENSTSVAIPWGLVAANLGVGQPTYQNSNSWANETVTINGRPTDHTFQSVSVGRGAVNATLDLYWDKATGVPVNVTEIAPATGEGTILYMNYVLIASNVWVTVPEFSPEVMVIIMTAVVGVAMVTALRRKERSLAETRLL